MRGSMLHMIQNCIGLIPYAMKFKGQEKCLKQKIQMSHLIANCKVQKGQKFMVQKLMGHTIANMLTEKKLTVGNFS